MEHEHMNKVSSARFDADHGYSWNEVMDMADELFETLHKKGFSSQDLAHIGLRLTHLGNFAWIVEGTTHMQEKHGKTKD